MRSRFVLFVYLCVFSFLGLLVACGGSTSNNNQSSNNNPSPGAAGPGSPGPGSSGSGGGGSTGSGSGGGGSTGSGSGGGSGSGSGASSGFVSYAYTAGTSAITGYGVKADGSLTPLSGSPYAVSKGLNTNIVTNGANVYATAADFRNLDVFSIDKTSGALTLANTINPLT